MISVTTEITMDLLRPSSPQIVYAKQGEALSRTATVHLFYNGTPWTVPTGTQFVVCYIKPDKTGGKYSEIETDGESIPAAESSGNDVIVNFPPQAFVCAGMVRCEVQMLSAQSVLSTFNFFVCVQESPEAEITSEDYFRIASLKALREDVGETKNLDTESKASLVAAINEVLSYLGTADELQGKEAPIGERLELIEQRLDDGSVVAAMQVPIASASSTDGAAYAASGSGLPTVATGETADDGRHAGKGAQIIFIQRDGAANSTTAPTLSLNGGEAIPIRFRAALSQGGDERAPDATTSVPLGALMNGVPYTMTFCGMYWLVDSAVGAELACAATADEARMMRSFSAKLFGLTDSDSLSVPIINTVDGIDDEIGAAEIVRSQGEADDPSPGEIVSIPSVAKVQEMIDAALREAAGGTAQQ